MQERDRTKIERLIDELDAGSERLGGDLWLRECAWRVVVRFHMPECRAKASVFY